MITLEGDQADVLVRSDGEPGIIGSALSLPHSTGGSFQNLIEDEHHHDDIVEHLDVIGKTTSFHSCHYLQNNPYYHCRSRGLHCIQANEHCKFHLNVIIFVVRHAMT